MSLIARMKNAFGSAPIVTATTPTTAVAFPLQDDRDVYALTGTVTIPSLSTNQGVQPFREVTFIGAASAAVTFTHTATTTTAGLMNLGTDSIILKPKDVLKVCQYTDGSWFITQYLRNPKGTATTGNTLGTTAVATGALTLPDGGDKFVLTAAAACTLSGIVTTGGKAPGRIITIQCGIGSANSIVFTNNAGSTTDGQFNVGAGANLTLGAGDTAQLMQGDDGVWRLINTANIT